MAREDGRGPVSVCFLLNGASLSFISFQGVPLYGHQRIHGQYTIVV